MCQMALHDDLHQGATHEPPDLVGDHPMPPIYVTPSGAALTPAELRIRAEYAARAVTLPQPAAARV